MSDSVKPGPLPGGHQKALVGEPQTARVVCVSLIGLALGVACGLWINARLASATSKSAPVRLLPEAHADGRAADAPPAVQPHASPLEDAPPPADEGTTPGPVADEGRGRKGGRDSDAAPAAGGTRPPASADLRRARGTAAESKETAARPTGGAAPCALYASASALNLRSGAAATLVVGGPGGQGVTVSTPDWSDIVVFPEGSAGRKGWLKYSVRSVSKRPGAYTVRFKTRCGSQAVRVTVGRP